MRLLYGEYELTVDEKNRCLIPAEIRKRIDPEKDGGAFFMVVGVNGKPWLYPERYYEGLVEKRFDPQVTPERDLLAFDQMSFALASRLEWDKQGRVLIPDRTLKRTGLGHDITIIGVRDHLELWNRDDWENERETLIARRPEIEDRAKRLREDSKSV